MSYHQGSLPAEPGRSVITVVIPGRAVRRLRSSRHWTLGVALALMALGAMGILMPPLPGMVLVLRTTTGDLLALVTSMAAGIPALVAGQALARCSMHQGDFAETSLPQDFEGLLRENAVAGAALAAGGAGVAVIHALGTVVRWPW